jgi:hypothetical protein
MAKKNPESERQPAPELLVILLDERLVSWGCHPVAKLVDHHMRPPKRTHRERRPIRLRQSVAPHRVGPLGEEALRRNGEDRHLIRPQPIWPYEDRLSLLRYS